MKKVILGVFLFCSTASAQPNQTVGVDFSWLHNGQYADGFRIYKGASPTTLAKLKDLPGADVRNYSHVAVETLPVCFGVSAYSIVGESALATKKPDGSDMCLGKPQSPTSFSSKATSTP